MTIKQRTVRISTAGLDGSAVGEGWTPALFGELLDIYLNYHASAPATTHVTITHEDAYRGTVLAVADSATDGLYAPRALTHKNTDGTSTSVYDKIALAGPLKIAVINSNALTEALVVTITYKS